MVSWLWFIDDCNFYDLALRTYAYTLKEIEEDKNLQLGCHLIFKKTTPFLTNKIKIINY